MSHVVAYILLYQEILVAKIPLGRGGGAGSTAIPRSISWCIAWIENS